MQLTENSREQFADMIEGYIYDALDTSLKEGTFTSFDALKQEVLESINDMFFEDEPDKLTEEVLSDSIVLEDAVEAVFADLKEACKEECDCGKKDCPICNPKESCKKESDDDDEDDEDKDDDKDDTKDKDDEDDEDDDDKDDVDEATLSKHHITKIQSVLDKRKRETDPKYKMSRRRTLMKIAARGGRVINKKLSKSVKKAYRQGFGKRWEDTMDVMEDKMKETCNKESDTEKDDVEGNDVKPKDSKVKATKKIKECVKVQKEAMEESVKEALKEIPAFGTLNESESASMTEAFTNLLSEHINKATDSITEAVLEEMDSFEKEHVIPELTQRANDYIVEEVIPSLEKDVNDYLDYVVNEKVAEIMESGKVYKSRDSMQLESFRDKLFDLIESELQIVPEQEDALIAMESKCDSLEKSLQEARIEKIKARNRSIQLENELWIEKNMPINISEATSEKIRDLLEAIESDTHEAFVAKASKVIEETTTVKTPINETKEESKKQEKVEEQDDIVSRTLKFMQFK